jgi:hypothetical protein
MEVPGIENKVGRTVTDLRKTLREVGRDTRNNIEKKIRDTLGPEEVHDIIDHAAAFDTGNIPERVVNEDLINNPKESLTWGWQWAERTPWVERKIDGTGLAMQYVGFHHHSLPLE